MLSIQGHCSCRLHCPFLILFLHAGRQPPRYREIGSEATLEKAESALARLREQRGNSEQNVKSLQDELAQLEKDLANQDGTRRLLESHLAIRRMRFEIQDMKNKEKAAEASLKGVDCSMRCQTTE